MKTISIALAIASLSGLALNDALADHQTRALLSPKLASIQISTVCTCGQVADTRDLARERGQLLSGKRYEHQPPMVATRGSNDPNLTKGLVHTGKSNRNPAAEQRFQLAPLKSK